MQGEPPRIAAGTQHLLVLLSGSVQGKRDGAWPPMLDTVSPWHHARGEKSNKPPLGSAQGGGFWGSRLPTGLGARTRTGSNTQRR